MSASYGVLSTYPPTQCGLATFSAALLAHLVDESSGDSAGVARVVQRAGESHPGGDVICELVNGYPGALAETAEVLNGFDVAIIQHEYGIYGGADGQDVLEVLEALSVPTIVVLHTVLYEPSSSQRRILEELVAHADVAVTMTRTATRRLLEGYGVDAEKVVLIPHGAPDNRPDSSTPRPPTGRRPVILTWGLLGPGKGIEWALQALAELTDLDPLPRYVVAGQTHPRVLEQSGEAYREKLMARAAELGVDHMVNFDPSYRDVAALGRLIRDADVVVLPYDSVDQVTSGVLIEAVTSAKPVVATGFPHARELLSSGAGLLVPRQSPSALAGALRRVLTEPGRAQRMAAEAARLAPDLIWPTVAGRYRELAAKLVEAWAVA